VVLAHRLALAAITPAHMVEASEFPHLAQKYSVYGVPRIVINEVIHIEGAVPEDYLMSELMQVMDEKKMKKLAKDWEKHS
jgi:predicted DsbA family dithiol-disulfide isomerase